MVWPFKKRHDDVAALVSPWTDTTSWEEDQKQRIAQRKKSLIARGLKDLTSKFKFLGDIPFAHGVMSSIYFGQLADGSLVVLKLLQILWDGIVRHSEPSMCILTIGV